MEWDELKCWSFRIIFLLQDAELAKNKMNGYYLGGKALRTNWASRKQTHTKGESKLLSTYTAEFYFCRKAVKILPSFSRILAVVMLCAIALYFECVKSWNGHGVKCLLIVVVRITPPPFPQLQNVVMQCSRIYCFSFPCMWGLHYSLSITWWMQWIDGINWFH